MFAPSTSPAPVAAGQDARPAAETVPAARPLRVLMLLTQMEAGGSQNAAIKLALGLEALGHRTTIAAMYDKGGYVPAFRAAHALEIIDLRLRDLAQQGAVARAMQAGRGLGNLWRLARRGRYDILLTFTHYSNFLGPVVGRAAGIPVRIVSQRGFLDSYPRWVTALDRLITNSRLVDTMTVVSDAVRRYAVDEEHIHPSKVVTIYTGINAGRYRPADAAALRARVRAELGLDESHAVIVHVARLHWMKGHAHLLEAAPLVLAAAPHSRFLLVGDGPLQESLAAQIRDAGLADAVRLLGARDDVPRLLAAGDVMILPSLAEGLPNVVLEGMAAGLPVVASAVGGIPELVSDGETGLLTPAGDAEALADGILRLVEDRALAAGMGARGRARVETEFTDDQTTARYLELFTRFLARKSPA